MEFDSAATEVVVVDHGFCHPDGSLYAPPSEEAIRSCSELVERAREAGVQVVHPPEQFEYALDHADWLFGEVTTREDISFA